jgi:dolichol-phosphate mannosyltransferase
VTPRLYVIVPVLNEEGNMARLMDSLHRMADALRDEVSVEVILVDDGSTDKTTESARELAGQLPLRTLVHPQNRGPGAAFGTAFQSLVGRLLPTDYVLTIEGDNTSRLELLQQMMTRMKEGFDVILASPYLYGGGIQNTTTFRVILSDVANSFVAKAIGLQGFVTMSSFFRLYRASAILKLQGVYGNEILERTGFESMIEMLMKMAFLGFGISEIAMKLDTAQRVGKSKMRIGKTIIGYLTLWQDKERWRNMVVSASVRAASSS